MLSYHFFFASRRTTMDTMENRLVFFQTQNFSPYFLFFPFLFGFLSVSEVYVSLYTNVRRVCTLDVECREEEIGKIDFSKHMNITSIYGFVYGGIENNRKTDDDALTLTKKLFIALWIP